MPPAPVRNAMAYRGRMVPHDGERRSSYQPENHVHRDQLYGAEIVSTWCNPATNEVQTVTQLVGKDPMDPPRRINGCWPSPGCCQKRDFGIAGHALVNSGEAHGDSFLELQRQEMPGRLTDFRDTVCRACSDGNKAEIRHCAIYDCPARPFRLSRNAQPTTWTE